MMKNILCCTVFCSLLLSSPLMAKVLVAEGAGKTEALARNAALRKLSEQFEVSVDASSVSAEEIRNDQYSNRYFQHTTVTTSSTLRNVVYNTLSSGNEFRVEATIDLNASILSYSSQLAELERFISQLFKTGENVNALRELMKNSQEYQFVYEQLKLLKGIQGETDTLPVNFLAENTVVLSQKFSELDKLIKLEGISHGKLGTPENELSNQALSMLSQQLGVSVKSSSLIEDELINEDFNTSFSEETETTTQSKLMGVTLKKSLEGDTVTVTATLEPRKALPLYVRKVTEFIQNKKPFFNYPMRMNSFDAAEQYLSELEEFKETASILAAMVGMDSVITAQDENLLSLWELNIELSKSYWLEYEYRHLDEVAEFIGYQFSRYENFEVCNGAEQRVFIDNDQLSNRITKRGSDHSGPSVTLVWFIMSEEQQYYLVLRGLLDDKFEEYKIALSPLLVNHENSELASRLLVNTVISDNELQLADIDFFYSDLKTVLEELYSGTIIRENPCLPVSALSRDEVAQVYGVKQLLNLRASPVVGKSNFGDKEFAKVDIAWEVERYDGNESQTFRTQGKKFPINDIESGIQEAFFNGLTKAKPKLKRILIL